MEHQQESVRIGPTAMGLGVFAVKPFRSEETIGRVCGTVVNDPEHESDYCIELYNGAAFEPASPFRYVNHSCRPNCALVQAEADDEQPAEPEVWIEAVAEIQAGEQLTIDYAWPAEAAIPCDCHSPECRGWIVAEDELHHLAPRSRKAAERDLLRRRKAGGAVASPLPFQGHVLDLS